MFELKINPTNLKNTKHNKVLYHFLMQNKDKNYFAKNVVNKVIINNKKYRFSLTNDILHRKRESDASQDRYEIVSNEPPLGAGTYGEITKFAGTLVPTLDEKLIFKNNIRRVDKKQNFHKDYKNFILELAHKEKKFYNIANPIISAKTPILVAKGNQVHTHMPMHLLTGTNLFQLLRNHSIQTVEEMLKLSISLIRAYQEQVHDHDIVHCDGKTLNVFADPSTLEVTVIDFGLSVTKGEKAHKGTVPWGDSAQKDAASSESHDMHAVGMMLGEIWQRWKLVLADKVFMQDTIAEFQKLPLLTSQKAAIDKVLTQTTSSDATTRMTSDQALEIFQQIRLARAAGKDVTKKIILIKAHNAGEKVRAAYRESLINRADIYFKKILYQELDSIECKDKNKKEKAIKQKIAINEFVETLGIKVFKGLSSKAKIINKFENIKIDYSNHIMALKKLKNELEKFTFDPAVAQHVDLLKSEIKRVINKDKKYNVFNVDVMDMLNTKFSRYRKEISKSINILKGLNTKIHAAKQQILNFKVTAINAEKPLQTLLEIVDSLPNQPVVIRAFAGELVKQFPKFKGIETKKTLPKLKNEIIFIAKATQFENKLVQARNRKIAREKLNKFGHDQMFEYRVLYKAKLIKKLREELQPNNKLAAYIYKIVAKKDIIKEPADKLNYSAQNTSDTQQMLEIIAPYKEKIDGISYSKVPFEDGKRVLIADVFDEWVKAPSNLLDHALVTATESLKLGILDYINQQYSSVNFLFRQRAASDRRLADMHRILVAINTAPNIDQMVTNVKEELKTIEKGVFKRSLLADIIHVKIHEIPSHRAAFMHEKNKEPH